MFNLTTMGTGVLLLTLATAFVLVLVIQHQATGKGVGRSLLTGLIGILLGAGGSAAVVQLMGYDLIRMPKFATAAEMEDAMMGMGGMGMGGMGMGGMGMGGGTMGMGGGGFGGRAPSPKRQLTTLVRKIELLTGEIQLELGAEQSVDLVRILQQAESKDAMTDDEATALHEELLDLFSEDQKAAQEAISLPRRRGGGGFGPSGGDGEEDNNPLAEEANAAAVARLLERFGDIETGDETPTEAQTTSNGESP